MFALYTLLAIVLAQAPAANDLPGRDRLAVFHGVARFDQANVVGFLLSQLDYDQRLQRELGPSSEQASKAADSASAASRAERDPETRDAKALSRLESLWNDKQLARFDQIVCQRDGPAALARSRYADRVGVEQELHNSIRSLVAEYGERSKSLHRQIFVSRGVEGLEPQRRLLALARELDEKILAKLSREQHARWIALLGERYDLDDWPCELAAAPDGSRIACRMSRWCCSFIAVVERESGRRVRLTDDTGLSRCPSFAPDGKRLAFSAYGRDGWDLHVIDADGKNDQSLKLGNYDPDEGACFTADGASLVFGTRNAGIYEYSFADRNVRKILPHGHRPAVSPDGRTIVYEESPYRPDDPGSSALLAVNCDGSHDRRLGVRGSDVQFSANGTLVFIGGEPLHREIWIREKNGDGFRQLTRNDGEKTSLALTSRGAKLLFLRSALYPGAAHRTPYVLYEMSVDGAQLREAAELWRSVAGD